AVAGDSRVSLAWSAATGATSYTVLRGVTTGGPYSPIASNLKVKSYPDTTAVNGTTYYYVVSASNAMGQSGNSNEAVATPAAPSDLIVSSLTVPTIAGPGSHVTVADTTTNQSTASAVASNTRFYLSTNGVFDANDRLLNGVHAVPALAGGASNTASTTVDIPVDVTAGLYYIIARADAD